MATTLIEGKYGKDSGSGRGNGWDKFVIKDLEMVAEEHVGERRRENYTLGACEAHDGKVFTIWAAADGATSHFWICLVDSTAEEQLVEGYAGCHLKGQFRVLAHAQGDTYAPRLLNWWDTANKARAAMRKAAKDRGEDASHIWTWAWQRRLAEHLATQISRRGIKEPAPMPEA
jgi:hypothetical protein